MPFCPFVPGTELPLAACPFATPSFCEEQCKGSQKSEESASTNCTTRDGAGGDMRGATVSRWRRWRRRRGPLANPLSKQGHR